MSSPTQVRTSVGYVTGAAVADTVVEMLADLVGMAKAEQIGDNLYQVFVDGDLDEVTHAELSGKVSGVAWCLRHLTENGLI